MNDFKLQSIAQNLKQMEEDLQIIHDNARKTEKKTRLLIHSLFLVIGGFALVNLYFVNDLAQEIKVIVKSMNRMYVHFGEMSDRVDGMRQHVENMGDNISLMPVMVEQMTDMSDNMGQMKANVGGMKSKLTVMRQKVSIMNQDITEMAGRFRNVNHNVRHMSRDVRDMSDVVPMR